MAEDKRQSIIVSAIVVHYNAPIEFLDGCLSSLLETDYNALEVILVLNGVSPKKHLQVLERWDHNSKVKILHLENNVGYGGGVNEGAKHARGKYIAALNDDVEFEPDWLGPIVDAMETQSDIGACQPKIRSKDNPFVFDYAGAAGGMLDLFGYPFARGRIFWTVEEDRGQYDDSRDIFWASGTAMVVRLSAWKEVGGFDPIFFLYAEEVDFCWQLHRLGYRVIYVPCSVVYHWGSVSTKSFKIRRTFLISRNHLILVLKNYSLLQLCLLLPTRIALELINVIYALLKRQPNWAGAILKGLLSASTSLLSVWRCRRNVPVQTKDRVAPPFYRGSIAFDYFIRRRLVYSELNSTSVSKCAEYSSSSCSRQLTRPFDGDYRLRSEDTMNKKSEEQKMKLSFVHTEGNRENLDV